MNQEDGNLGEMNVIVELSNMDQIDVLKELSRSFPGTLEYIAKGEIRTLMLSQSLINPGLTSFYRNLMSISDDNNEVYMINIPTNAVGLTFREYAMRLHQQSTDNPLIAVGVKRPNGHRYELICNPRPNHPLFVLQEGDQLVVLSYDPPHESHLPH